MGPPKGNVKYAPVEAFSVNSAKTDSTQTSKPEAVYFPRKTSISMNWMNTIVSPDQYTGSCAEIPLPAQLRKLVKDDEPEINWKQVMGCLAVNATNFPVGIGMAYTSALIPALLDEKSDIHVTKAEAAWIASVIPLIVPIASLLAAVLMERVGRLASVQINTLPFCLAWVIIAMAPNFTAIMIGRILTGVVFGIGPNAASVLVTEIALKKYRGPLACTGVALASLGMLFGYGIGALVHWRTAAWISSVTPLLPSLLTWVFAAESPIWLRSKGREEAARRACLYYYKDPEYSVLPADPSPLPEIFSADGDIEKSAPTQKSEPPVEDSFFKQLWLLVFRLSGFKPLIILNAVLLLQQLAGIYITLYYAVTFFQTAGTVMDPYVASVLVGGMRFFACTVCIFLLRACRRRPLMIVSTVGMAICMGASGYSTKLALAQAEGGPPSPLPSWFTVGCVITYVFSAAIGLQSIPWTMTAELFPQRVRGAAQSVNICLASIFMFVGLQLYPFLDYYLGGSVGVQYLFAGSSLLAAFVCWIFLPETHGKTLGEIEEYFVHNTIFLGSKK